MGENREERIHPAKCAGWSEVSLRRPTHSQERMRKKKSLLSPTSPIQGGRAKQCPEIEQISSEVNFGRDGGAQLFFLAAACWLRAPQRRWPFAGRTRILSRAMLRRPRSANRNFARTARFATG